VPRLALSQPASAVQSLIRQAARPTRILLLYQQQAETQPMVDFTKQLRSTLSREVDGPVEFYQESLDLDRFKGRERSSLSDYFSEKYRGFALDVIVPVGSRALQYAVDELDEVLPDVPIVFALCASPQTNPASLPARATGRLAPPSRFEPTLQMAHRLQPDAERVVVIGGVGRADSASVSAAVHAVTASRDPLPLTVLQGPSLDVLLATLRRIPHRSIVLFANYRQDARGQSFEPVDIVGSIAHASAAPMYTQLDSYLGEGVVGGSMLRIEDEGSRTGRLVIRVLRRRPTDPMPPVEAIGHDYVVDWRQLRRFGLSESALPPGTEVLYREPTLWQRHRTVVLGTIGVIIAELLLIGTLLAERRRRIRAQAETQEQQDHAEETRRQVAHMGRVAMLGELAATMSHEIRQPLAAIRANAETGARLAARGAVDDMDAEGLYAEIFDAIISDNTLASDIITRVRALVRREALPQRPVDLNEVCLTAARLLEYEAKTRHAQVELSLDPDLPSAVGDPIQFQQVVLNLMMNALDASASAKSPRLTVRTMTCGEEIAVEVRDNGPGISEEHRAHLFESFYTTKRDGLGLGLAIAHSIVERHHGRVEAENGELGGAIFRIVVPGLRITRVNPADARLEFAADVPVARLLDEAQS